jgi:hypothetical protein
LNESASREEKGSSTAAAEDYSLEDDDSHRQILDSVAYQWDRMPVPAGSSVIEDTNPTGPDEQRHIPLGPDTGLQIGERNDFDRILQLLIKKMKLEMESTSRPVDESHQAAKDESTQSTPQLRQAPVVKEAEQSPERNESVSSSSQIEDNMSHEIGLHSKENFMRSMDVHSTHEPWFQEECTPKKSKSWHIAESHQGIKNDSIPLAFHARAGHSDSDSLLDLASLTKSVKNKANTLLSMEDLLESMTKDIPQKGTISASSDSRDMETSMPQLDCSGSSGSSHDGSVHGNDSPENESLPSPVRGLASDRDKFANEVRFSSSVKIEKDRETKVTSDGTTSTTNLYETEYGSEEESEMNEENHQPKETPDPTPSAPAGSLLSAESSIKDVGGLKINLSSLQASKPGGGLKIDLSSLQASKPSGRLTIDLSSLQASKPSKKAEAIPDEIPQPEKVVISAIKTFPVDNLPFTGRFGESGMYTGLVSEQYEPHGKGTMLYDNGEVIKGYWSEGDFVRESELYSDSEDDDEDSNDEGDDMSSSMSNIAAKGAAAILGRDRSRSRSRSKDRDAPAPAPPPPPPKPPSPPPSPPLPEYSIGDPGRRRDMIVDKDEAILIIEHLRFGDGA